MDEVLRDAADEGRLTREPAIGAFLAGIAPIAGVWIAKIALWPRPFWVHFYDPETIHFYAGLYLLRGLVPENVDNPGTPLQLLSAVIAAVTGATPQRYEAFLSAAHLVELLLALLGAAIVFYGVLDDAPRRVRIAGVWLFFCAPSALERLDVWSPEILYLPLGAAAIASFRRWLREPVARWAMLTGAFIGLAIAGKFVFLPWAVALGVTMLIARRLRDAVAAGGGVLLGFVIGTLPVITAYDVIFRRLLFLSGAGHADQSWPELLASSRGWLVCVVAIAIVTARVFRRSQTLLVVFCAAIIVFSVIAATRNPSFRYFLPAAVAWIGLLASVTLPRKWQLILLLLIAALLAKSIVDDLSAHRRRIESAQRTQSAIGSVPQGAVVIYGWRTPVPAFALRVMTEDPRYLSEVSQIHPREGHLNPWTGRVHLPDGAVRWDYAVVGESDLRHLPNNIERVRRAGEFIVVRQP